MLKAGLIAFITLFAILDPLGNVPVFLALSRPLDAAGRRRAATQATAVALVIIFTFALIGRAILSYLGVTLQSLTVAGGALLALVALDMLRGHYDDPQFSEHANIALVPLGTPLIAGPGAIAATMVMIDRHHGFAQRAAVWLGIVAALALSWVVLSLSAAIGRRVSTSLIHLLSRVIGLLLAGLAVELIFTGARDWIHLHG